MSKDNILSIIVDWSLINACLFVDENRAIRTATEKKRQDLSVFNSEQMVIPLFLSFCYYQYDNTVEPSIDFFFLNTAFDHRLIFVYIYICICRYTFPLA